ncbi:ATP-binding protein [Trabulsiella odontotermitis]|uniref:sensor histidine kinase n=1 Tax=Trabulsiella odontotermitis TaxID=379893 RepID=UPI0024B66CCE|nr:ATP-binding protein [Trabulsiella odontotermitis]WHP32886.1 ATP-binding protein [Trabulsiella odontotermitis]
MRCVKAIPINSLSLRILLAYVVGTLLSIGLLVAFGAIVKERLPGMALPERTQLLAERLQFDAQGNPTGFIDSDDHPLWIYDSLRQETAWRVLDDKRRVVLLSPGATTWPDQDAIRQQPEQRFEFTRDDVLYDGAREMQLHDGRSWFVELAVSSRMVDFLHLSFALHFIRLGVIAFSLVLLVTFAACVCLSLKYALRPLRKISQAATQISPRSLSNRLETEHVPAELIPLIASFNQALGRLEKSFRSQQDFLATAAHELKTPLTLLRAEVELMEARAGVREPLLMQVSHLARQVQQLLLLAEASEPLSYRFSDVNAGDVVRDAAGYLQRIADDASVRLTIHGDDEVAKWHADRGALFTLLKNLIENAIQHAPVGTIVSVDVRAESLSVRDQGAGVEPEEIPHLFERFWRGAHRRDTGAGLGLAICQEICTAHGWTLTACNGLTGLTVTVYRIKN